MRLYKYAVSKDSQIDNLSDDDIIKLLEGDEFILSKIRSVSRCGNLIVSFKPPNTDLFILEEI